MDKMIPISTLNMIDRKIALCESKLKTEPKKYTYMYESLKQIRSMVLLEVKVMNKAWLN